MYILTGIIISFLGFILLLKEKRSLLNGSLFSLGVLILLLSLLFSVFDYFYNLNPVYGGFMNLILFSFILISILFISFYIVYSMIKYFVYEKEYFVLTILIFSLFIFAFSLIGFIHNNSNWIYIFHAFPSLSNL